MLLVCFICWPVMNLAKYEYSDFCEHSRLICSSAVSCLVNALPGQAFTAVRMKDKGGGAGHGVQLQWRSNANIKIKTNSFPFMATDSLKFHR